MKKCANNEKGITLVEVLAVIVIGALIIVLISNTHLFGQKQYKDQSKQASGLYDVSYALKVITKDIRKASNPEWVSEEAVKLDGIDYKFNNEEKSIDKAGIALVKDIELFNIKKSIINGNEKWKLIIKSSSGKEVETEIVLR